MQQALLEKEKALREQERERREKEELARQNAALQAEKEKALREQENERQARFFYCVSICTFLLVSNVSRFTSRVKSQDALFRLVSSSRCLDFSHYRYTTVE